MDCPFGMEWSDGNIIPGRAFVGTPLVGDGKSTKSLLFELFLLMEEVYEAFPSPGKPMLLSH